MNNYVFTVLQENWYKQYQVLLFVHSRNDTVKCAKTIIQNLQDNNQHNLFFDSFQLDRSSTERERFQNHQINDLLRFGLVSIMRVFRGTTEIWLKKCSLAKILVFFVALLLWLGASIYLLIR